jgi:hypothetical protein
MHNFMCIFIPPFLHQGCVPEMTSFIDAPQHDPLRFAENKDFMGLRDVLIYIIADYLEAGAKESDSGT